MADEFETVCFDRACGWNAFSNSVGCSSGDGSCPIAEFLTAEESDFHTAELIEATQQIRSILSKVPKRKDNQKLGLVTTPFGVLLAWVQHDLTQVPEGSVTINSPDEEIIKALGIIREDEYAPRSAA